MDDDDNDDDDDDDDCALVSFSFGETMNLIMKANGPQNRPFSPVCMHPTSGTLALATHGLHTVDIVCPGHFK